MKTVIILLQCLLVAILAAVLYLIFLFISGLFVDENREYQQNSPYFRALLNSGAWCAKVFSRTKIQAAGLEHLPEGRFLIVGNHRSNFDPILTWYVLRDYNISYISKAGNFNIPFYGRIIRRCCCLEINRESPRESMDTILKAAELLKSGEVSVGVYPEGTRSHSCVLLPFHNGVFKIAKKADVPIVVVCMEGTEKIHHNFPLHRTNVHFTVADVIPSDYVRTHRTDEIGQRVRDSLSECFYEH